MIRERRAPRPDWRAVHDRLSFTAVEASSDDAYWSEDVCYRFSASEIDTLEQATQTLHDLCMEAVGRIIQDGTHYDRLMIPPRMIPYIERSWRRGDPSIYGRFDLAYDGADPPKMLEYNADTPTSLYEAAVLQWHWLKGQDLPDQFNFIHEQLIDSWRQIVADYTIPRLYFAADQNSAEDFVTTEYLRDTAMQAGLETAAIAIDRIGWDDAARHFVDEANQPIRCLFKLYPWEFIAIEDFGIHVLEDATGFMEPPWKMILSNKAILPILWEMFPGHQNLLPASFTPDNLGTRYVEKPIYSREGANIAIVEQGSREESAGDYAGGPTVFQAYAPLPVFDGYHAVVGSWVVGGTACGLGIREDQGKITTNAARFVPHYFTGE